jgi:hypothetical protein
MEARGIRPRLIASIFLMGLFGHGRLALMQYPGLEVDSIAVIGRKLRQTRMVVGSRTIRAYSAIGLTVAVDFDLGAADSSRGA